MIVVVLLTTNVTLRHSLPVTPHEYPEMSLPQMQQWLHCMASAHNHSTISSCATPTSQNEATRRSVNHLRSTPTSYELATTSWGGMSAGGHISC